MFYFWKNWHKDYRNLLSVFFGFFIILVVAFIFVEWQGDSFAIKWELQTVYDSQPNTISTFQKGIFPLTLEVDNYFIQNKYIGADLKLNPVFADIYAVVLLVFLSIFLAIIPQMKKWVFYGFFALFTVFLVSLRLDILVLFGNETILYTAAIVILYLVLSYYFFAINKNISFIKRLLAFFLMNILTSFFIYQGTNLQQPVMFLVNYALAVPIMLSVAFIVLVCTEIPHFVLFLLNNAIEKKTNLRHFSLLTIIYLINLVLLYLKNAKIWELDIIYFEDFYILVISAVLGLWGISKNPTFEKILPFNPAGAVLYVVLGGLTFATLSYIAASASSSLIEFFKDIIVYTHLAFGLVFLVGTMLNYRTRQPPDKSVYEDFYEDEDTKYLPNYIARGISFLIVTAMLMKVSSFPVKQGFSGYLNGIADGYSMNNQLVLADIFYQKALEQDYYSPRTQYTLATLAKSKNEYSREIARLEDASFRKNIPQTYTRISENFENLQADGIIQAIQTLKEGVSASPKSKELANNLALLYGKLGISDSVIFYLEKAKKNGVPKDEISTNFLSFLVKNQQNQNFDNVIKNFEKTDNLTVLTNQVAVRNIYQKPLPNTLRKDLLPFLEKKDIKNIGLLTTPTWAYLSNYTFNQIYSDDSTSIDAISFYQKSEKNRYELGENLVFAKACWYYYHGDLSRGIDLVEGIKSRSPMFYNYVLGLWFFENNQNEKAINYFKEANFNQPAPNINACYALSLAFAEQNDFFRADSTAKFVATHPKTPEYLRKQANKMHNIFTKNVATATTDEEKLMLIHYKQFKTEEELNKLVATISDKSLQVWAQAYQMKYFVNKDVLQAEKIYQNIDKTIKIAASILSEMNVVYLKMLLAKKDYNSILSNVDKMIFTKPQESYRAYYKAVALDFSDNKDLQNIANLYKKATFSLLFEEDLAVFAGNFFQQKMKKTDVAYTILLSALRFNEKSVKIIQAYALQCIEYKLITFGDAAANDLQDLMKPADLDIFIKKYQLKKDSLQRVFSL